MRLSISYHYTARLFEATVTYPSGRISSSQMGVRSPRAVCSFIRLAIATGFHVTYLAHP